MKKMLFVLALLSILFLAGCTSNMSTRYFDIKTLDISGGRIVAMPLVADLDVSSTRVTAEDSITVNIQDSKVESVIQQLKSIAVKKILDADSADVLVEPKYETVVTDPEYYQRTIKVIVTGFPATYKNIRNASKDDAKIINAFKEPKK